MTSTARDHPEFELTIDDAVAPAPVAADIVEIDIHEENGHHGRCTLLVQNWDADRRAVRYSDDGPFRPGAAVAVALGYHSDLTTVFDGVITALCVQFPADGRPVLRVEARSRSILLSHPARSRCFSDLSDGDIVGEIANDYRMTAQADDGAVREAVVSDRATDWEFLTARAARLGQVLYVRGTDLVMRAPAQPSEGGEPHRLAYTRDLLELHLTQDLSHAVETSIATGWDPQTAEPVTAEQPGTDLSDADWPLRTGYDETDAQAGGDDADARATARARDAARASMHGRGACPGNPALRCDSWVEIAGIGDRFTGPHYLSATRHRLSATGYRTEFQIGKPPPVQPPGNDSVGTGLALGVVLDLEDPLAQTRVKVSLPWRSDGGDGIWARLAATDAGDGYGTLFVPNVGQEVVLGFVDGDAAAPVILGQLYNGVSTPPMSLDPDRNGVRAIITPGGHRVVLDDGDPAALVLLTSGGQRLALDDSDSSAVVEHADGNSVRVSGEGIELSAVSGDIVLSAAAGAVKIDAATFEASLTGPSKLETSATLDVSASATLGLTGALVTIN